MAERFPLERIPPEVRDIAAKLTKAGHEAWYVGGAVRDMLLDRYQPDSIIDIATSARPEEVQKLFRRTVPIGIEHGTIAVLDSQNRAHEVTTFRKDVVTDGRHAEVAFGVSLEEDLARRDFTINAIAAHPESGEMRDPFDGVGDAGRGLVRAVGDPATRFKEDYLRVLRALRFAATLGFSIEPGTWAAVRAAAKDLAHLSRERVRDEWFKSLTGARPSLVIRLWDEAGVLREVWPEIMSEAVPDLVRDPVVVTAGLLDPARARQAAQRMRFSNRDIDRVTGIVKALEEPAPDVANPAAVRHWMSRHRVVARDAASLRSPALLSAVELQARAPLTIGDLAVKGDDLTSVGIPPGPQMGSILRRLLDAVLDDPSLNVREALLERAKAWQ